MSEREQVAATTPEQALNNAVMANTFTGADCSRYFEADDALSDLRAVGWDVTRTPPDLARIREQAFVAGIAYGEARQARRIKALEQEVECLKGERLACEMMLVLERTA